MHDFTLMTNLKKKDALLAGYTNAKKYHYLGGRSRSSLEEFSTNSKYQLKDQLKVKEKPANVGTAIRNFLHKPYMDHHFKKGKLQNYPSAEDLKSSDGLAQDFLSNDIEL